MNECPLANGTGLVHNRREMRARLRLGLVYWIPGVLLFSGIFAVLMHNLVGTGPDSSAFAVEQDLLPEDAPSGVPPPGKSTGPSAFRVSSPSAALDTPAPDPHAMPAVPSPSPVTLRWNEAYSHIGEEVTLGGSVRWCEMAEEKPARYSFDARGRVTFEIDTVDRLRFTKRQILSYCGTVQVRGPIVQRFGNLVIFVVSPAQVTLGLSSEGLSDMTGRLNAFNLPSTLGSAGT